MGGSLHHLCGVGFANNLNEGQLQRSRFLGPTRALDETRAGFTDASE
jgi:hypothetical protein